MLFSDNLYYSVYSFGQVSLHCRARGSVARSLTIWISLSRQHKRVWGGEVSVGGRDRENQTRFACNELHNHISDLLADVRRLVADGQLC